MNRWESREWPEYLNDFISLNLDDSIGGEVILAVSETKDKPNYILKIISKKTVVHDITKIFPDKPGEEVKDHDGNVISEIGIRGYESWGEMTMAVSNYLNGLCKARGVKFSRE